MCVDAACLLVAISAVLQFIDVHNNRLGTRRSTDSEVDRADFRNDFIWTFPKFLPFWGQSLTSPWIKIPHNVTNSVFTVSYALVIAAFRAFSSRAQVLAHDFVTVSDALLSFGNESVSAGVAFISWRRAIYQVDWHDVLAAEYHVIW